MNLNHLNLRVRDAEVCRDFYIEHFDFEAAFEAEGGYFLRNADGFLLALVPASSHTRLPDGFHIGFGLDDGSEVRSAPRRLKGADLEVSDLDDHGDYVTFRCWDPDGTEIEVFWESS